MTEDGWEASAAAWVREMDARGGPKAVRTHKEAGDWGRLYVLDAPMLRRVRAAKPQTALDVGCGEGRFCRMLAQDGVAATGVDRTAGLVRAAASRDPGGAYVRADAAALPFADDAFQMVVSYNALLDIADHRAAIAEMARVVAPGGRVLIANLSPQATALDVETKASTPDGVRVTMRDWLRERAIMSQWRGIRVRNWHRPLSAYMDALLSAGLTLSHFEEPDAVGARADIAQRYGHLPWFLVMEWVKPR